MANRQYTPQERPPTLGELAGENVTHVRVWCNGCGRYAEVPMAPIIEKAGPNLYFPQLSTRLRCNICNAKDTRVMPQWPASEMGTSRNRNSPVDDLDEEPPGE